MAKKISFIVMAIVFAAIILAAALLYPKLSGNYVEETTVPSTSVNVTENKPTADAAKAPDFTVVDAEGKDVSLADFAGKPVIINFWATWCSACKSGLPALESMYKKYGNDIQFLIINQTDGYQDTIESASQFIKDNGYSFPVYFDTQFQATHAYSAFSIPRTYLVDENGNLVTYNIGAMSEESLEEFINRLVMIAE